MQALPIGVRVSTWEKFQVLYSANISRGGVFVRCSKPPAVGAAVLMRFGLPDGQTIEIKGEVVHVRTAETALARNRSAGMGVRFIHWTEEERAAVAGLAERAAKLGYGSEAVDVDELSDSDDPFD